MSKPRILIVEDEVLVAQDAKECLEGLGYCVLPIVATGQEAIKTAESEEPDAVLMDIRLRGEMDGIEAAERIQSSYHIPVVFLTAYADDELLRRAKALAPAGYIVKPFAERELFAVFEMALERAKLETRLRESEKRVRSYVDHAPHGIFITDENGRYIEVNSAACSITGYTSEELLTMVYSDLLPPEAERYGREHFKQVSDFGEAIGESAFVHKSGEVRYWSVSAVRLSPSRFMAYVQDITRRKRAEEALHESEKRFMDVLYSSSDAILLIHENTFVDCNEATAKMLGYANRDEFLQTHPSDLSPPTQPDGKSSYEKAEEMMALAFERGFHRFEWIHRRANGEDLPVEVSLTPIIQNGRDLLYCIWRDITEQQRAQAQLHLQSLVLDQIQDHVTVTDLNGIVTYVNEAVLETHGRPKEEIVGHSTETYGENKEKGATQEEILEMTHRCGSWRGEVVNYTQEGNEIIMDCRTRVVRDENGNPIALCGISTNITERILAEKERVRLISAVEQAAEAIVITDPDAMIQYVNPAFERISGYMKEEAVGQNPRILKSGKQDDAFYQKMWDTLMSGEIWAGQIVNRRKNGSLYTEEATISPVRDASGKTVNYVAVKRDVTHEMELETHFRHAQKMEAIGTLAGGIAHDFNNILSALMGYTDLAIQDAEEMPLIKGSLEEIAKAANRATDLVRQILAFSRRVDQDRRPLRMQIVLKEVRKLLRGSLPSTIEIREDVDSTCRAIMADAGQMHQVIMNLCTNAYQAMEEEESGELRLELAEVQVLQKSPAQFGDLDPGDYVRFSVSDTGMGMDEETQKRIFEPYFTTKEIGSGTGLGLATVHGIVKSHGGEIMVFSEPGEGSTFHVYLPVCQTGGQEGLAARSQEAAPKGDERILFVDDEEMIVDSAKQSLERLGYTVETGTNGEEALRLFYRNPSRFDLVITDLTMPRMTGTRLAREILKTRPDIPIVLCTGYSEKLNLSTAKAKGFVELLRKPIDVQVLATILRRVLDRDRSSWDNCD